MTTKREVAEWVGKTPDSKPPASVRLRVFERWEGRCYLSGRKIQAGETWDLEHVVALCNGGENREANMRPALREAHKIKTRADLAEKSKVERVRRKHLGIKTPKRKIPAHVNPWGYR